MLWAYNLFERLVIGCHLETVYPMSIASSRMLLDELSKTDHL